VQAHPPGERALDRPVALQPPLRVHPAQPTGGQLGREPYERIDLVAAQTDRATLRLREGATLKLENGTEIHVDLDSADLGRDEITLRRISPEEKPLAAKLAVIDQITAAARPHPAGTTGWLLAADHNRAY